MLALCGVLDAVISVTYLMMLDTNGPLTFHVWNRTDVSLGKVALAAGACTIAAGIWRPTGGRSWLLVLNGAACSAFGLIFAFWTGPIAFRTVALLIAVMALSLSIYEFATARNAGRRVTDKWLLGAAGVGSVAFALWFIACVLRWIRLEPASPTQSLLWLGSFFGFSAICMLGLALQRPGRTMVANVVREASV